MNAYIVWYNEFPKTEKPAPSDAGEMWKRMSEEEKRPYKEKAKELLLAFKQEDGIYKYNVNKKNEKKHPLDLIEQPFTPGEGEMRALECDEFDYEAIKRFMEPGNRILYLKSNTLPIPE